MTVRDVDRLRRRMAAVLMSGGAAVLIWQIVGMMQAARLGDVRPTADRRLASPSPAVGEPLGTLEIPRLTLSGAVAEGDDESVLKWAIGHLPDTPLPWQEGNSAVAAHRDRLFRSLEHVRPGDALRLATPCGDLRYRVREILVVDPEDVWVLDPTPVPTLTLITCYPFTYIGAAPRRFVVHAERLSDPDQI